MTTTNPKRVTAGHFVCQSCDWRGGSVNHAIQHEHNRHDGAQTCWANDARVDLDDKEIVVW